MTKSISTVDVATDTYAVLIAQVNTVIDTIATEVVTVNTTAGISTGNGFNTGIFGSNTLVANVIQGGNVSTLSNLTVSTNAICQANLTVGLPASPATSRLTVGNSTINVAANATQFDFSGDVQLIHTSNMLEVRGGDLHVNTNHVYIGSASSNCTVNSTAISWDNDNVTLTQTTDLLTLAGGGLVIDETLGLAGDITPSQITSDQDDYNPAGMSAASTLRLDTDAPRSVTGIVGGTDGRILLLHNIGGNTVTFTSEDSGSTAANRFAVDSDATLSTDQSLLVQYDATSSRWRIISAPSAALTAAGSDQQVQYNSGTSFSGDAGLIYVDSSNTLNVGNTLNVNTINGNTADLNISVTTNTFVHSTSDIEVEGVNHSWAGGSAETVDSWTMAGYRGAEYVYTVDDNGANAHTMGKIIAMSDDGNGLVTDYAVIESNGSLGSWSATQNSTHVLVQYTSLAAGTTTIKGKRTLIPV